jgi:hypothetical protein
VLRRAAPRPEAYERCEPPGPEAAEAAREVSLWPFSRQFCGYSAFTALAMLGYATFAVLAYLLESVAKAPRMPEWRCSSPTTSG